VLFTPTSKYPSVSRDISIVIRSEITAAMCISELEELDLPLLKNLELFDDNLIGLLRVGIGGQSVEWLSAIF